MVQIAREPDLSKRKMQLEQWVKELKALKSQSTDLSKILQSLGEGADAGKVAGKAVGDMLVSMLLPANEKIQQAEDRTRQTHDNVRIAFALAPTRRTMKAATQRNSKRWLRNISKQFHSTAIRASRSSIVPRTKDISSTASG